MPSTLLTKVALAGWNDTDPLSLAKARAVLRVVREEIESAPILGAYTAGYAEYRNRLLWMLDPRDAE